MSGTRRQRAIAGFLPIIALVVGVLTVSSAAPAAAYGTCSVRVPARLVVDAPYERFPATLAADCSSSSAAYAVWDIRHSYYGPDGILIFDGNTSTTWDFYDWDHLGTYLVEPSTAWDYAYDELAQNSVTVSVRLGSRLSISSGRAGKYVTVRSTATRYTPSAEGFRPWAGKAVKISVRNCATCAWRPLKTLRTNRYGRVAYRVYAPRARFYKAETASTSVVWGKQSRTVKR